MHGGAHSGKPELLGGLVCRAGGWIVYAGAVAALGLALAPDPFASAPGVLLVIGAIGAWRYGWSGLHLLRAFIYLRWRFPRLRRAAEVAGPQALPPEVFVLVTSYREDPRRTAAVFASIFGAAHGAAVPVTVIALLTDKGDQTLVESVATGLMPPPTVRLVTIVQDGSGKRAALAEGLRAIARRAPRPGALVLLVDGDTLWPPDLLSRVLPFFGLFPRLGAVTVDTRPIVTGSRWAADWYALRSGQRHLLMASMSLSRRLLVLTGRMSAFRAELATAPRFIAQLEADHLEHWRHGRFRLLTGDDKTTWFRLLQDGWDMLYLPDVAVRPLERIPDGRFLRQSHQLMSRWFGNMLRGGGRALALGPRRIGVFPWWCLADQRLSMWTSLSGPAFALLWAAFASAQALLAYLLWVLTTRLAQALLIGALRGGEVSARMPLLLYYTQVVGSLIKIHVGFRLNRQRWARQGVGEGEAAGSGWDVYAHTVALGAFFVATALIAGVVIWPDSLAMSALAARLPDGGPIPPERAAELQRIIDQAAEGAVVELGAGEFRLAQPLLVRRDDITLAGAGAAATRLIASFSGDGAVLAVIGQKVPSACGRLTASASRDSRRLAVSGVAAAAGENLLVSAANDDAFLDELGARCWRREQPELRRTLGEAVAIAPGTIELADPLGLAMPEGARVCPIALRRGVTVRDLSIVYDLGGAPPPDDYRNLRPEAPVDGIRIEGAAGPRVERVAVINAGRHPLHLDTVLAPRVGDVRLDGAWNKGAGGNGYLRIARTVRGSFDNVVVRGLRHVAVQWSSHDNRLSGLDSDSDLNFHGGFAHHNSVEAVRLQPRAGHPWPPVVRTAATAGWAPPDGPANLVTLPGSESR